MSRRLAPLVLSAVLAVFPSLAAEPPIALDRATAAELASLDHVDGPLADRIVAFRDARGGRVSSVDALRGVEGMTLEALQAIRANTGTVLSIGGDGRRFGSVDEVLATFSNEPSIQQVHAWTQEYARTSPEMVRAWASASQTFGLLPTLQVEYLLTDDLDRRFAYEPVGDDFQTRPTAIDELQGFRVLVRSQWDLGELVMSSERIRVANEAQDVVKLRDRLLTEVTRLYFERRRQQVALLLEPPAELRARVDAELRLLELTAGIDALTGGRFSGGLPGATR
jgi:hypothetical protein